MASTSSSRAARSSATSGPTVPARRRRCGSSWDSPGPRRARRRAVRARCLGAPGRAAPEGRLRPGRRLALPAAHRAGPRRLRRSPPPDRAACRRRNAGGAARPRPAQTGSPALPRQPAEAGPPAFRNLFAMAGADMSTPVGYVQIELLSFMGPVLVLLYAVGAGRRRWRARRTGAPSTCSSRRPSPGPASSSTRPRHGPGNAGARSPPRRGPRRRGRAVVGIDLPPATSPPRCCTSPCSASCSAPRARRGAGTGRRAEPGRPSWWR